MTNTEQRARRFMAWVLLGACWVTAPGCRIPDDALGERCSTELMLRYRCAFNRLEICGTDGGDGPTRWRQVEICDIGMCVVDQDARRGYCAVEAPRDPRCPAATEPDGHVCSGQKLLACRAGNVVTTIDCAHVSPSGKYATGAPDDEGTFCEVEEGVGRCAAR